MESLDESIRKAVDLHLPGRTVLEVKDRGEWLRRLVEVTLDRTRRFSSRYLSTSESQGMSHWKLDLAGRGFSMSKGFLSHGSWRSMIHVPYSNILT